MIFWILIVVFVFGVITAKCFSASEEYHSGSLFLTSIVITLVVVAGSAAAYHNLELIFKVVN